MPFSMFGTVWCFQCLVLCGVFNVWYCVVFSMFGTVWCFQCLVLCGVFIFGDVLWRQGVRSLRQCKSCSLHGLQHTRLYLGCTLWVDGCLGFEPRQVKLPAENMRLLTDTLVKMQCLRGWGECGRCRLCIHLTPEDKSRKILYTSSA
jgi:hypothetical protein